MKKLLGLTLLALTGFVMLGGCQTTRGLGEDVENTGENVQEGIGEVESEVR